MEIAPIAKTSFPTGADPHLSFGFYLAVAAAALKVGQNICEDVERGEQIQRDLNRRQRVQIRRPDRVETHLVYLQA